MTDRRRRRWPTSADTERMSRADLGAMFDRMLTERASRGLPPYPDPLTVPDDGGSFTSVPAVPGSLKEAVVRFIRTLLGQSVAGVIGGATVALLLGVGGVVVGHHAPPSDSAPPTYSHQSTESAPPTAQPSSFDAFSVPPSFPTASPEVTPFLTPEPTPDLTPSPTVELSPPPPPPPTGTPSASPSSTPTTPPPSFEPSPTSIEPSIEPTPTAPVPTPSVRSEPPATTSPSESVDTSPAPSLPPSDTASPGTGAAQSVIAVLGAVAWAVALGTIAWRRKRA